MAFVEGWYVNSGNFVLLSSPWTRPGGDCVGWRGVYIDHAIIYFLVTIFFFKAKKCQNKVLKTGGC